MLYDIKDCWTCNFVDSYSNAMRGVDQNLFGALDGPVIASLAGLVTAVLMFRVMFEKHFNLFRQEWAQTELFVLLYRKAGRLAFATLALSSYQFWRTYVIDVLNGIAGVIAVAAMSAGDVTNELSLVASEFDDPKFFTNIMFETYKASYGPIDALWAAVSASEFGGIGNIGKAIGLMMVLLLTSVMAALSNVMFMLFIFIHLTMTTFVSGMGPLIIAFWVFEKTKPFAAGMLRMLIGTATALVTAAFVLGMCLAVVARAYKGLPVDFTSDDQPLYRFDDLYDWILSTDFIAAMMSYVSMAAIMLIFSLIAVIGILTQGPKIKEG